MPIAQTIKVGIGSEQLVSFARKQIIQTKN